MPLARGLRLTGIINFTLYEDIFPRSSDFFPLQKFFSRNLHFFSLSQKFIPFFSQNKKPALLIGQATSSIYRIQAPLDPSL